MQASEPKENENLKHIVRVFIEMTIDTLSLNVIGFSTKFILHVIVLQSSLIVQPSSSVWDIPEHEAPTEYSLSNPRHNDVVN